METAAVRLKALRMRTVPKISSRDVAEKLGLPPSTYAAYEDPKKTKKPIIPVQLAKQLADIFVDLGIDRAETLALAGITGDLTDRSTPIDDAGDEWVEVIGSVQAGVWREQSDWAPGERYDVRFGSNPRPGTARFALRMDGLSMNLTIPPGSDLECLTVGFSQIRPEVGSLVIVARNAHDLTELTCKRLDKIGDDWVLRCESSEKEFQEVIKVGKPDNGMFTDDETRIIGLVLSAKQDLAPPGYGTRRYNGR